MTTAFRPLQILMLGVILLASCADTSTRQQQQTGATLFTASCAPCHGEKGAGIAGSTVPPLDRKTFIYGRSKEAIEKSIRDGRPRDMPAYGGFLQPQQIDDLTRYILKL
jgi:cytochrome c oxidase cbb3-type subunit III